MVLSIANVSLSKGRSYYQKENYYSKDQVDEMSRWHGKLAADLGLIGNVGYKEFDNLLFGYAPDGSKELATNAVNPKKYQEPLLTKKDRGNVEFGFRKISDRLSLGDETNNKILKKLDSYLKYEKKITTQSAKEVLTSIEYALKDHGLKSSQRQESLDLYKHVLDKVTRPNERRAGYDLTFSAPKSVSILALVYQDEELLKAHEESVKSVLTYIEEHYSKTRTGNNTNRGIENTGRLAIAKFNHDTSRALDPQLHTHCIVLNLIKREDGKYRSLHADDYRSHSVLFGTMYQSELAFRAKKIGYEIESRSNGTFDIKSVPQDLKDIFSKRRKQILEQGGTNATLARTKVLIDRASKGEPIDKNEKLLKWNEEIKKFKFDLDYFKSKDIQAQNEFIVSSKKKAYPLIEFQDLIQESFNQSSDRQVSFKKEDALNILTKNTFGNVSIQEMTSELHKKLETDLIKTSENEEYYVTKEALERESNTKKILEDRANTKEYEPYSNSQDVEKMLAEKQLFSKDLKDKLITEIKTYLENSLPQHQGSVLNIMKTLGEKVSQEKRISLIAEREIKEIIYAEINSLKIKGVVKKEIKTELNACLAKAMVLTSGQEEAIRKTLLSTDKHIVWLGVAGAGKTYSFRTIIEQAKNQGYDVRGFAQNADAAKVFSQETGIEAHTVASLVVSKFDSQESAKNPKKLWIIDEAGMIGAKLGHDLSLRGQEENARFIIAGDNRQLSAPEAGHFLKFVSNYTNLPKVEMTQSVRQKNEALANGVEVLNSIDRAKLYSDRYKPTAKKLVKEALEHFKDSLVEYKRQEKRVEKSVEHFISLNENLRNKTLIVARTHKLIGEVTGQIRKELKQQNYLKNEIMTTTFIPSPLSQGQLKYAINFEFGDLVRTGVQNPYLEKNKTYKVIKRDTNLNSITVDDVNGKRVEIKPKDIPGLMAYKKKEIEVAENDWMRWTKNEKNKGRINKQMFKIVALDRETNIASIRFEKGHTAQVNLNEPHYLDYAWAVTYNASQGVTKRNIIGLFESSCNFEDVYTLFTRASHSMQIYMESKESLERSLLKSGSNRTATELVNEVGEAKLAKNSNKMDFYDRYQKILSFNEKDKTDKSIVLSFSAPSDISACYFTLESKYQKKLIKLHEKAIDQTLIHFKKHSGIQGDFQLKKETRDTIFEKEGLSKIQYIHSVVKIDSMIESGIKKEVNRYPFIQNQVLLKNQYEFHLAEQIKGYQNELKSLSIVESVSEKEKIPSFTIFQEDGILRVKERVNHVHAVFSDHFENNMKRINLDKFLSAYEINELIEKLPAQYETKNKPLNWGHILKDLENEKQIEVQNKSEAEILKDVVYRASRDLQVFDESKLYDSLIYESKSYLSESDLDRVYAQVLLSDEIRFLGHDRFGKMLFAHHSLSNEESNIIMTSILKKDEKECALSFERVQRRLEKLNFDKEKTAATIHLTTDKGGVKFLSGLSEKNTQEVIKETAKLYKNSDFKMIHAYAGMQRLSDLNKKNDVHIRKLVEAIRDKKQVIDKNTVIIINDLAKNISKTCSELLDYAKESKSKVILVANESDFKTPEEKRFLHDLKRTSGVHFKTRYKGFLKQQEYYNGDSNEVTYKTEQNKNKKVGINDTSLNIKSPQKNAPVAEQQEQQRLQLIMTEVKEFYVNNLFSERGKEAFEYLMHTRGFTLEQIKEFGFGLSFTYGLQEFARIKGYSQKDLETLSLLTRKDNGDSYDFYRNRIMIPINNKEGNCVGFGGRIYRNTEVEKGVSKYINPRNNPLFNKSTTLFGLDSGVDCIKKEGAIVVEGYMDALSLKKEGISNVVAVMGTALTKENLLSLKALTNEITLLFDNDKAGIQAVIRSFSQAKSMDLSLSCASMKTSKDADEYLKSNGIDHFREEVLGQKKPIDDVLTKSYGEKIRRTKDSLEKLNVINDWKKEVLPSILSIKNQMDRNFALKNASLVFETKLSELVDPKHYKYIPRAFLSKEELNFLGQEQTRQRKQSGVHEQIDSLDQVHKDKAQNISNKFNQKLMSEEKTYDLFRKIELDRSISSVLNQKEVDVTENNIEKFIKENPLEVEKLKSLILENEGFMTSIYMKDKLLNMNAIEIYREKKRFFPTHSAQTLNEELKKKYLELINKEQKILQQPEVQVGLENSESTVFHEIFDSLSPEMEARSKLISELEFSLLSKEEHFKTWENLQSIPFSYKEKVFDEMAVKYDGYENIQNKINSEPESLKTILRTMEASIQKYSFEYRSMESQKMSENNIPIDANVGMREKVSQFENNLKQMISDKLQNKEFIEKGFEEVRKILLKESLYLVRDETNQYKSYFSLIRDERVDLVKPILKDIDFKKLEAKYSISNHVIEEKFNKAEAKFEHSNTNHIEPKLLEKLDEINKNFGRIKSNFSKLIFEDKIEPSFREKKVQKDLLSQTEVKKQTPFIEKETSIFKDVFKEESLDKASESLKLEEEKGILIGISNEPKIRSRSRLEI